MWSLLRWEVDGSWYLPLLFIWEWSLMPWCLGGNSQNFLRQIIKIFVTLGLELLGLWRLKVYFWIRYHYRLMLTTGKFINNSFMNNCLVKEFKSYKNLLNFPWEVLLIPTLEPAFWKRVLKFITVLFRPFPRS